MPLIQWILQNLSGQKIQAAALLTASADLQTTSSVLVNSQNTSNTVVTINLSPNIIVKPFVNLNALAASAITSKVTTYSLITCSNISNLNSNSKVSAKAASGMVAVSGITNTILIIRKNYLLLNGLSSINPTPLLKAKAIANLNTIAGGVFNGKIAGSNSVVYTPTPGSNTIFITPPRKLIIQRVGNRFRWNKKLNLGISMFAKEAKILKQAEVMQNFQDTQL